MTATDLVDEVAALAVPAGSTWLSAVTLSPTVVDSRRPRLALDAQGGVTAGWVSPEPDGTDRVRISFRVAGAGFGPAQAVPGPADVAPSSDIPSLQVARDRQGGTLVVWTQPSAGGPGERVRAAYVPAGGTSSVPETISAEGEQAGNPQVEFGRDGDAFVVWTGSDGANTRVRAAIRPAAGSFGAAQTLSEPGQDAFEPQLTFDRAGRTHVVWTRSDGLNRRVEVAVRPAGGTFGSPRTVSASGQDALFPQVAVDAQGSVLVVWERLDSADRLVQAVTRPADGSFGPVQTLSPPGQGAFMPRLALDSRGGATVVWRQVTRTGVNVQAVVRPPQAAAFGPPQTFATDGPDGGPVEIAVDGAGDAVAVWARSDGRVQAAVRPAGRPFRAPETLSETGGGASSPQVVTDGSGPAVVVWQRRVGSLHRIETAFRAAAQTISEPGQAAGVVRLEIDPQGNATALWETFDGTSNRLQATSRLAGGQFGPTQTFSNGVGSSDSARVAVDPGGNALAAWSRTVGPDSLVQAAFRPVGGSFGSPQNVSGPGQDAGGAQVAFDGQGTAIAVWVSSDATTERLQAAVRPAGGSFGPVQTVATGSISFREAVVNAKGDALVAWNAFDGTSLRILAAFRPAGGSFGPPQVLSAALTGNSTVEAALDAQGNGLVIWHRSDGSKIRVEAAFRPAGGSFGPASALSAPGQNGFGNQVAFDATGNALVVWLRSDGTHMRIQAAFRPSGGSFEPTQTLSPAGGSASQFTRLAFDAQGNALVVWDRSDGGSLRIQAAFRPAGGTFGSPQTLSPAGQNASGGKLVVFDGSGNSVVVWGGSDGTNDRINAASRPAGGAFGPSRVISDAGQNAFLTTLVVDAQGDVLVAWNRFDGAHLRAQVALRPAGGVFGPP